MEIISNDTTTHKALTREQMQILVKGTRDFIHEEDAVHLEMALKNITQDLVADGQNYSNELNFSVYALYEAVSIIYMPGH